MPDRHVTQALAVAAEQHIMQYSTNSNMPSAL